MGRAWLGRSVARGRVASDRSESCKCTVFKVGLIVPLRCEASYVLLRRISYPYEGSAWAPAFASTHASGRAGQHFELFDSILGRVKEVTTHTIIVCTYSM